MNKLIIGLVLVILLVGILKLRLNKPCNKRKQDISSSAASTTNKNVREIKIIAKQYSFSPNPIRLRLNEQVRFRIISQDVLHGFSIPELGIDQVITPGKETVIDFYPSIKGTFSLICSIT